MAKTSDKTLNYIDKYQKKNVRQVLIKVNRKTEPEMLEWLEQFDNLQGYIKQLILADMAKYQST